MAFKFYTCIEKVLNLKVKKCWGVIPNFVEVTEEKLVGGLSPILNRVNSRISFLIGP